MLSAGTLEVIFELLRMLMRRARICICWEALFVALVGMDHTFGDALQGVCYAVQVKDRIELEALM